MKKLSDCIKLIKGYKKQKKNLIKDVVLETVVSCVGIFLICAFIWASNFSSIFWIGYILSYLGTVINVRETVNDFVELEELKKNYKVSLGVVEAFAKELKAKGIKLSKDSLLKSNVYTNKKVNDIKIITAFLDDAKKEIRIIEEPKESSVMTANNGLSVIPSPKKIDESVYYVDKDLVIDEPEEKEDFNGNVRRKRRF